MVRMSQNNSRKLQGSKNEIHKHVHCQEVRNIYQISTQADPQQASFSNISLRGILDRNVANGTVSDWELTGATNSVKCSTSGQTSASLLTHQNLGVSRDCTGDVSRKPPEYAAFCDKENCTAVNDVSCDTSNLLNNLDGRQVKGNNLYICQKKNSNKICHGFIPNSNVNDTDGDLPCEVDLGEKQSRDNRNTVPSQCCRSPKKTWERRLFHLTREYQHALERDVHPKLLSKKLGLPCLRPFSNSVNIPSIGSSDTRKSHSSVSFTQSSPIVGCHHSSEMNTFPPDDTKLNEMTLNMDKPIRTFSPYAEHCQVTTSDREENNNYMGSQSAHELIFGFKRCALSSIQRLHERLHGGSNNSEIKRSNSRVQEIQQKFLEQKHQNPTSGEQDAYHKHNLKSPSRVNHLYKEEKPYRQWHRLSRVVTTERKFMISPEICSHALYRSGKKTSISEQIVEPVTPVKQNNMAVETGRLILRESVWASDGNSGCPTEKHVNKPDPGANIDICSHYGKNPVSTMEMKNEKNKMTDLESETGISASSTTLCAVAVDCDDLDTNHVAQKDHGDIFVYDIESSITLTDARCTIAESIKDYVSKSAIHTPHFQSKSSMKSTYLAKLQRRKKHQHKHKDEAFSESYCSQGRDYIPGDSIDTIKPLNSICGVSQVTGPPIHNLKKSLMSSNLCKTLTFPIKGPILRTANRSRYLGNIPTRISERGYTLPLCKSNDASMCDQTIVSISKSTPDPVKSRISSRSLRGSHRHSDKVQGKQNMCYKANSVCGNEHHKNANNDGRCITTKSTSKYSEFEEKNRTQSSLPTAKSSKLFLANAANKLLQRVSRAGLSVHWSKPTQNQADVKANADFKPQKVKETSLVRISSDDIKDGCRRTNSQRKKDTRFNQNGSLLEL